MKKFIISLLVICTVVLTAPVSSAKRAPKVKKQEVETTTTEVLTQEAPMPELDTPQPVSNDVVTNTAPTPEISEQEPMAVKTKKEKKQKNKKQKVKKPKQKKVIKDDKTDNSGSKASKPKAPKAQYPTVQTPKKRSKLALYLNPNIDIHEVRASHILVKKRKDAVRIRKDIINGTISFEDAAREYSLCPTGMRGGDLGYFNRRKMEQLFADVAFDLKVGQISDPVGTKFGWHIIKVTDKR